MSTIISFAAQCGERGNRGDHGATAALAGIGAPVGRAGDHSNCPARRRLTWSAISWCWPGSLLNSCHHCSVSATWDSPSCRAWSTEMPSCCAISWSLRSCKRRLCLATRAVSSLCAGQPLSILSVEQIGQTAAVFGGQQRLVGVILGNHGDDLLSLLITASGSTAGTGDCAKSAVLRVTIRSSPAA